MAPETFIMWVPYCFHLGPYWDEEIQLQTCPRLQFKASIVHGWLDVKMNPDYV